VVFRRFGSLPLLVLLAIVFLQRFLSPRCMTWLAGSLEGGFLRPCPLFSPYRPGIPAAPDGGARGPAHPGGGPVRRPSEAAPGGPPEKGLANGNLSIPDPGSTSQECFQAHPGRSEPVQSRGGVRPVPDLPNASASAA